MKKIIEKIKLMFDRKSPLHQPIDRGSFWEYKLIGINKHSVFTWCKDCHGKGVNIPLNNQCGNCGGKNTVRYYDNETIDLLF